jgi:hypothetical protein
LAERQHKTSLVQVGSLGGHLWLKRKEQKIKLPYCKKVLYSKASTTGENMERKTQDKALEVAVEWASLYIDALGGDSRKYRQALEPLAPLQYQRREIGEGDFVNCTKEQFEYAEGSPTMDTRVIAAPVQEPVAWVPYLSDRADGVQGHYAIARWNPRGYREVWNLRRHTWGAFSDDVMSLEEADYLLQQITIPTRKPATPVLGPSMSITDRQIERALKAACMHSTTESRKDMRRAIEAAIDHVCVGIDSPPVARPAAPDGWRIEIADKNWMDVCLVSPFGEAWKFRSGVGGSDQFIWKFLTAMLAAAPKKDKE